MNCNYRQRLIRSAQRLRVACPLDFEAFDHFHLLHFILRTPTDSEDEKTRLLPISQVGAVMRGIEKHRELSYLYHMEFSGHSKALIKLCREAKVRFRTPLLDVGTGTGGHIWWLRHEGLLPPGRVSLIDIDQGLLAYAEVLLMLHCHRQVPLTETYRTVEDTDREFSFRLMDGCLIPQHLGELGGPFRTIFSVLVIQWVDHPQEMMRAIADSLRPKGKFILVGENFGDAISFTPLNFPLDISQGKPIEEIIAYGAMANLELESLTTEPVPYVDFPDAQNLLLMPEEALEQIEAIHQAYRAKALQHRQTVRDVLRILNADLDEKHIAGMSSIEPAILYEKIEEQDPDWGVDDQGRKMICVRRRPGPHNLVMLVWRRT